MPSFESCLLANICLVCLEHHSRMRPSESAVTVFVHFRPEPSDCLRHFQAPLGSIASRTFSVTFRETSGMVVNVRLVRPRWKERPILNLTFMVACLARQELRPSIQNRRYSEGRYALF